MKENELQTQEEVMTTKIKQIKLKFSKSSQENTIENPKEANVMITCERCKKMFNPEDLVKNENSNSFYCYDCVSQLEIEKENK